MHNYEEAYKKLNAQQRAAVDQIDGPLLVLAGPGTGKTQLLSVRVAHILQHTDTPPQNILCLTFTENGASNMRERLTGFIGQDAYSVNISTYHALGGELIRRFPEYFAETRLQNPIDELGKRDILSGIVDQMSYQNPLKQARYHLGDLVGTISEVKRALLTSERIKMIAHENSTSLQEVNSQLSDVFRDFRTMPRKVEQAIPYFEKTLDALRKATPKKPVDAHFGSLMLLATQELENALETAHDISKTKPLTEWKNAWLAKDSDNSFIVQGELQNRRLAALADVLQQYQQALEQRGLYDFDDMILRSIQALEQHADLKYTLQEQYLYVLLDEFQDTNAAQLRLVELLTDNPVHEGRPNVMAVGDDDQAIYAFQGAHYSNMMDFYTMYRDVDVINLTDNYRSHSDILHTAHNIAAQIENRLHHNFSTMSKLLTSVNATLTKNAQIERHEFLSDIAHYDWIAQDIRRKIDHGVSPSEIAVLAPRHRYLEPLVGYLNACDIPVRYEKRENILETPVVKEIITMSKLVLALQRGDDETADSLWPEVLSYPFWQFGTSDIWQVSWQVGASKGTSHWSQILLNHPVFRKAALLFLNLAGKSAHETCETILDYLIGTTQLLVNEADIEQVRSPLRSYYTDDTVLSGRPDLFYETLSHLTVLRTKLREYQKTTDTALTLEDLIQLVKLYEAAGERMLNTSPYNQQSNAVQLMTVFKAKGLEFEHVYLPCCLDDVWGESARSNSNKLTLPANIAPIRHAGANQDERLRIFFVAITRAKIGLYIASYDQAYNGKATKRLKYLNEQLQEDGTFASQVLPAHTTSRHQPGEPQPSLATLEQSWRMRHVADISQAQLRALLEERLHSYQLSPTHVNSFVDLVHGGPVAFFFNTILQFPTAPTSAGQYGNAMHETMEWLQHQIDTQRSSLPGLAQTYAYFERCMKAKKLSIQETELLLERGKHALAAYIKQRGHIFKPGDKAEHNFRNESVFIDGVHMAGKIDRMEIDKEARTITVVDYKTGESFVSWKAALKLHKYKQQLYCYKLLIEGSDTYKGYRVIGARLEFIEPDSNGKIQTLSLEFNKTEMDEMRDLLKAVWRHVKALDLPDVSKYPASLAGAKQFEQDLRASHI